MKSTPCPLITLLVWGVEDTDKPFGISFFKLFPGMVVLVPTDCAVWGAFDNASLCSNAASSCVLKVKSEGSGEKMWTRTGKRKRQGQRQRQRKIISR